MDGVPRGAAGGGAGSAAGFTLIEMLVVLAIIVVLMVLIAPSVNTILRGSQITQAAQMVSAELALAQQTALTKNLTVEVRLYQWADSSLPGETAGNPSTGHYRAIQMYGVNKPASGSTQVTYTPLDKVQRLPGQVIIDAGTPNQGATLSSLISSANPAASPSPSSPVLYSTPTVPLPQPGLNYNYVAFHFTPGGSTDLPPSNAVAGQWFFTLHNITDGDPASTTPKNFFTLQINSINGHLRDFRP